MQHFGIDFRSANLIVFLSSSLTHRSTAGMLNNNNYPTTGRAWFTVVILLLAYVLSFIDRQILNLLVGPIRADLGISDTQMSLLMRSEERRVGKECRSRWSA